MDSYFVLEFGKKFGLTMEQALFTVLNSDTYTKLLNDKTCFYYQSPRYVYDFLKNELKTGKIS